MQIKIKRLSDDAVIPEYAHHDDAGADVYSTETCVLRPLERRLFSTGICLEIPEDFEVQIRPKSGLALNYGLTVLNSPGTIDAGYRGEIKILMINLGDTVVSITKGQKIAQLVASKVIRLEFVDHDLLSDSVRSEGGFGSTGLGQLGLFTSGSSLPASSETEAKDLL